MTDNNTRSIIHDARNSLNRISIHAELALMLNEKGEDSEQIKNALAVILRSCKECDELINQVTNDNNS